MLAYHGKAELKEQAIAEMRMYREADTLVKGRYWQDGKGCAVGCRYKYDDHKAAERVDGIPAAIAHLEGKIFKGLPNEAAMHWLERYHEAIPVGADLSQVADQFMLWLLTDEDLMLRHVRDFLQYKEMVEGVEGLYRRRLAGDEPSQEEWHKAAEVLEAEEETRAAAWAAAVARTAVAAWERMADKLIELLEAAPVPPNYDITKGV